MAETTENTETTPKTENAEERAKNFWAYWRNAPTVLKAFAITLLVITTLAILGNITEGPGTTYVVSDQSGTGVVSEGPVGSKQNNLKDLYYEVLGKAGDYQRSKKLFDSCQVQYPPAKYKDVCGGKSHAYAKEKLAAKVDNYNRQAAAMLPSERVGLPSAFDAEGNPVSS